MDTSGDAHRVAEGRLAREIAFDAIVTADHGGGITSLNAAAERMFGAIVGKPVATLFAGESQDALAELLELARRGDPARCELVARHARGSTVIVELRVAATREPGAGAFVVLARDLTGVKTAEHELRLSDAEIGMLGAEAAALRRITAAIATGAHPDAVFSLVAKEVAGLHGAERGTVVRFAGRRRATIVGAWASSAEGKAPVRRPFSLRADSSVRRAMRTGASARLAEGGGGRCESVAAPIHLDAAPWGALAIATSRPRALADDAEQRVARFARLVGPALVEAEARSSLAHQAAEHLALATIGEHALRSADIGTLFASAVKIVAETLRVARVRILEAIPDEGRLELRARSGRPGRTAAPESVPVVARTPLALAIDADLPVVVDDVRSDERFAERSASPAARSAISVAIRLRDGPWGVLEAESREPGHFGSGDSHFLLGVANVLASAIERRQAEDMIRHQAMHDPLTRLANRSLLGDRLTIALERAGRMGRKVAVMMIDIDHFKAVNETLGHSEGDAILVAIARRLSALGRPGDTAARIGSDEFALLCEEVGGERGAAELAEQVVRSFRRPLSLPAGVELTASVGVVMRGAGDSAEVALRDAHTATARAKANGRDRFEVFDASMRTRLIERRGVESDLRRAIEQDEIVVYYQPIVSLGNGTMDGVEALARWDHPQRGLLGPREFISVCEETGLIVPLGLNVLEHACRDAARWNARSDGDGPRHVSVNLSALQIAGASIVDEVTALAATWGLPPGQLGLEITETIVLYDDRIRLDRLEALRAAGIRIILDDFGTGYSSLSYLRKLPLDVLKLDRSFITGIGDDPGATAIVAAVTRMADSLALSVVAEGVETLSELRALEEIGCQLVQGYFFARPMRLAKLERLFAAPPRWLTRGRSPGPQEPS